MLFLKIPISFTSLIPCLLPPREEREMTERTTAQLPAIKKCCLLIFAIAIGCLVLADFQRVPFRSLWYIRNCRSPSSWLSCYAGSPKRSWRFGVHFAVPPARNPIYKQKIALKAIFICIYAKIIVSLHPQFHAGDVCASSAGVADILKRRLLTLCSDCQKSRKFQE